MHKQDDKKITKVLEKYILELSKNSETLLLNKKK